MKTTIYILFICLLIGCSPKLTDRNKLKNPTATSNIDSLATDSLELIILDNPKIMSPNVTAPSPMITEPKAVNPIIDPTSTSTPTSTVLESKYESKSKSLPPQSTSASNKNGQLVYSMPDTMTVGASYKVVVRIINTNKESLITINEGLSMVSKIEHIRTSSTMQVELNDPDKSFTISKSNSSEIQIVDSVEYTEWIFNVIPSKAGIHPLSIVSSIITANGTKDKTYINTVFVKMNILHDTEEFWDKEWKWLFSTIIIPFIVWFYNNRKKKKDD